MCGDDWIYRQVRDELLADDVPDLHDAQDRAFLEMGPEDVVDDRALLTVHAAVVHPGLEPGAAPASVLWLPTDYELARWDRDREDPR